MPELDDNGNDLHTYSVFTEDGKILKNVSQEEAFGKLNELHTNNMNSSGKVRTASSGAVRDNADDKPLMELLPLDLLMRVSAWYTLGAKKYGDNNWLKGQPQSWCVGSILRHLTKYCMGMRDEDHLSAIVFNALSIMNVDEHFKDDPELYNANPREDVKGNTV